MSKAKHARSTSKSSAQPRKKAKPQVRKDARAAEPQIEDFDPQSFLWDHLYDIKTVAGLVESLGGEGTLSETMGVTPSYVHAWVISGNIQPGWHLQLLGMACDVGKTVSPTIFGYGADGRCEVARGLAKMLIPKRFEEIRRFRQEQGGANV